MSRISAALLVLILLLALILRVWGLDFGLPYMFHPDEPNKVSIAQRMFHTGDLNPHYFLKPTLFIYLNALLYFPYAAAANAAGVIASAEEIQPPVMVAMGVGRAALPSTILLGRSLTVLVGMVAVGLTYLLGRRIYGTAAGLLAALLAALSSTLVEHSRSITENMFLVAAILATAIFALKVLERGATRDYLLTGICAGFAASFKYPGALALSLLPAAHFLRCGWTGWRDQRLYMGLACAPLAFLLGTPFALFDLPTFLDHVFFEAEHYTTGHPGMEGNSLRWYVSYAWQAEGPALLLGVAGLIWGVWRRSRPIVLLTIFPGTYFVFIT